MKRALLDTLLRVYPNVDTGIEIEQHQQQSKRLYDNEITEEFSETRTKWPISHYLLSKEAAV
ncbi:hypothetical protein ACT691_11500 [Vibrio metschnikovii]